MYNDIRGLDVLLSTLNKNKNNYWYFEHPRFHYVI